MFNFLKQLEKKTWIGNLYIMLNQQLESVATSFVAQDLMSNQEVRLQKSFIWCKESDSFLYIFRLQNVTCTKDLSNLQLITFWLKHLLVVWKEWKKNSYDDKNT